MLIHDEGTLSPFVKMAKMLWKEAGKQLPIGAEMTSIVGKGSWET